MQTECLTRLSLSVTTCTCEVIQDTLETQDKAKQGTLTRALQGIQKETNWKGGGRKESIRRETTREGAEGCSLPKGRCRGDTVLVSRDRWRP